MAENKKISELDQIQSLNDGDEFVVVDKSTTSGADAASSGKTTRVSLSQIKDAVSASGSKGEKGDQGAQGAQGAQGPKGDQGAQGAQGARGATGPQGPQGTQGAQGPKGDQGAQGVQGARGATGAKGATGSTGAKGATGAAGTSTNGVKGATGPKGDAGNVNAHLSWSANGVATNATGHEIRKINTVHGWGTGFAYSNFALTDGCSLSFSPQSTSTAFMIGLSASTNRNSANRYFNIDHGFYCTHSNGAPFQIRESGQLSLNDSKAGTYSASDIFTVTYDNHYIKYFQNGNEITKHRKTVGAGKRFFIYISIHDASEVATSMINFVPAGPRGSTGATGSAGARGATGATGPRGATGAKGATGATGARGATGQKGATGARGATGQKGATGAVSNTSQFLRSDTSDSIAAGAVYTFGKSDTESLRFTNSSYSKSLYIGGWTQANSSGISRIRNSNDNLHLDSGSQGNLYLNHYSAGKVYACRGGEVYHSKNLSAVRKNFPGAKSASHYALDNWLEFKSTSNHGIYWGSGTGVSWHIFPKSKEDMYIRSGHSSATALVFTNNNNTPRGYVYANSSNQIGFLNQDRHWRFVVERDKIRIRGGHQASSTGIKNYSPNLWFQEDGPKIWSGDAPANQGKIEYHSNRFYINAGSNSARIVEFRRGGKSVSYVDNAGKFIGNASNADKLGDKAIGSFVRTDANSNVSADTEWQDNKSIYLGTSADYRMHHNSNHHTYFQNRNHGKSTYFQSEDSTGNNRAMIYMDGGSRPLVRLFEHGSERLRTMSYGIKVTSQMDLSASNGKSGYINVDTNAFVRVGGRGAGVGLFQEDAYGAHEIMRFQNHGIASDKKRPVAIFGYGTLSARQRTTFTRGCLRIGAQNTQYEGGEIQLQGPKTDGNAISIDFFDDSTLNAYQNNKSTHNVRFFNTENGAMFGMIGDKGAQFRRGFVKIINDNRGKNSHLYLQTTSSINKTIGNQKVSVGTIMNNFAVLAINGQNDLNPSAIIESTSLWFRNNELHAGPNGIFNRSGDVKRGHKVAIDPYGNVISVRAFIANHKFSDLRLKKDVLSLDSKTSLEKVKSLRGVSFRWKDENSDKSEGKQVGLIAQEVQKIVPEIVSEKPRIENNDGSKETPDLKDRLYIEYSRVVPLLIESVKELSSTIDSLKAEIEDLKNSK